MSNSFFCPQCKRELTGALEMTFSDVGQHTYLVTQDTSDCNWRRCRGCKTVLCKQCDDDQRLYCDEGRIVARERAGAALAQTIPTNQFDKQPVM